jgi:hypothetical protein
MMHLAGQVAVPMPVYLEVKEKVDASYVGKAAQKLTIPADGYPRYLKGKILLCVPPI